MSTAASYIGVRKYVVKAICESPLHIGSSNGEKGEILVHPVDQIPFIQGTAMAGVFSDYIGTNWDTKTKDKWFGYESHRGNRGTKSRITFEDCRFIQETLKMELRPRIKLDGETGTVQATELKGSNIQSGQITNVEYISEGAEFQFTIYQFIDLDQDDKIVEWCLAGLNKGEILLGGLVSVGCGVVRLTSVWNTNFDLCKAEDLKAWMKEDEEKEEYEEEYEEKYEEKYEEEYKEKYEEEYKEKYEEEYKEKYKKKGGQEILHRLVESKGIKQNFYNIKIHTGYKNSILIKGNSLDSNKISELLHEEQIENVSAANIMNGKKEFIIPGSSFKGALKSRMESIADYWDLHNSLIDLAFSKGVKIYFYDAILKEVDTTRLVARNAINKMTGGAKNQALFFEVLIGGKTEQTIKIDKAKGNLSQWSDEDVKGIIGLILYALRDFAIGAASMGGGASIGRGFMDISKIEIFDGTDSLLTINVKKNKTVGNRDFLESCFKALKDRRDSDD